MRALTEEQLQIMDEELKHFERINTVDRMTAYLKHKLALNKWGEIRPQVYERVMNEIEQWLKWRKKKHPPKWRLSRGEKEKLVQLETLRDQN